MNEIKKRSIDINRLLKESLDLLQKLSFDKTLSNEDFNRLFNRVTELRKKKIQSNQEDQQLLENVIALNEEIKSYQDSKIK